MIDVHGTIARLKRGYHDDPEGCSLWATVSDDRVRLRPLQSIPEHIDARDIELLTRWRNQNRGRFLTDFEATPERTLHWLTALAGPDLTRILFMLDSSRGETFGHVGLCEIDPRRAYGELDNIVRGEGGPPGAMRAACATLSDWATSTLGLEHLAVRVMADNPAVGFYERIGYRHVRSLPAGLGRELRFMERLAA